MGSGKLNAGLKATPLGASSSLALLVEG